MLVDMSRDSWSAGAAVGSANGHDFIICLEHSVGVRRGLKVVQVGLGRRGTWRKCGRFVGIDTFPGFSAGSQKVHVRTWLVRTGKVNIPHSVHLSGYRPILSHAALNKQYFWKRPSL